MIIRSFTPDDYNTLNDTLNAVHPDDIVTAEDVQRLDSLRDSKCRFQRWAVEHNGHVSFCQRHNHRETSRLPMFGAV